jgi:hypothetical protein
MPWFLYSFIDSYQWIKQRFNLSNENNVFNNRVLANAKKRDEHPFIFTHTKLDDNKVSLKLFHVTHANKPIPHPLNNNNMINPVKIGNHYYPKKGQLLDQYAHTIGYEYILTNDEYEKFLKNIYLVKNSSEAAKNVSDLVINNSNTVIVKHSEEYNLYIDFVNKIGISQDLLKSQETGFTKLTSIDKNKSIKEE